MFRHILKLQTTTNGISLVKKSFGKAFYDKYLIWTNIISSGVLLGMGDLVQQEIEFRQKLISKRYDFERMGNMFLVGLAQGPMHHYFYKYLDIFLPKNDVKSVGKKILIDQLIASPVFIISFFYGLGVLEQKKYNDMREELRSKFLTVYIADWCIWPPSQFINFYFLGPKFRVLYINAVTMLYDVFLSYIKHTDQQKLPLPVKYQP